jgi:hypothetical protein
MTTRPVKSCGLSGSPDLAFVGTFIGQRVHGHNSDIAVYSLNRKLYGVQLTTGTQAVLAGNLVFLPLSGVKTAPS